jgi:large subunit ribosomal protein L21
MFAVIRTGGKQYRVAAEDVLRVDPIDAMPGEVVEFADVLVVGGEPALLGTPTVAGATVAGELLDHVRGPKVIAFKKRRRKNSRRKRGHRQEYSLVRITEILTDGRRPAPTPPPRPSRPGLAEATEGGTTEGASLGAATEEAATESMAAGGQGQAAAETAAEHASPAADATPPETPAADPAAAPEDKQS